MEITVAWQHKPSIEELVFGLGSWYTDGPMMGTARVTIYTNLYAWFQLPSLMQPCDGWPPESQAGTTIWTDPQGPGEVGRRGWGGGPRRCPYVSLTDTDGSSR